MNLFEKSWLVASRIFLTPLLEGLYNSVSVARPIRFFWNNRDARVAFFKCIQLNGALFLGSMAAMHFFVSPLLKALVEWVLSIFGMVLSSESAPSPDQAEVVQSWAESLSSLVFKVLWLYPVYCISFILNANWYQEVADEAQQYFKAGASGATTGLGFFKMVRDEIFRLLLVLGFVIQASLLGVLPDPVGSVLQFACYSWLFSFYCFEYGWAAKGWRLLQRTRHFENNWLFYLGFGAPGAAATTYFPSLINGGVFALIFPLCIALGASYDGWVADNKSRRHKTDITDTDPSVEQESSGANDSDTPPRPDASADAAVVESILDQFRLQMPIFKFPVMLANFLVRMIQLCCCTKWEAERKRRRQRPDAKRGSSPPSSTDLHRTPS